MKTKLRPRFWILIIALSTIISLTCILLYLRYAQSYHWKYAPELRQVSPPAGAQILLFPMESGVITAGYRNPNYYQKNGYPHYGLDVTAASADGYAEVLASGEGVVLGTEFCDNSLGHIAVIRYDSVFIPETGDTWSLIARYYHMKEMSLQTGDTVSAGQVIGSINRKHEQLHHIHLELDADLAYPFHTPQVAEASSELLHRYPASGEQIINPISVLVVGGTQRISVSPAADSASEQDIPRFGQKSARK